MDNYLKRRASDATDFQYQTKRFKYDTDTYTDTSNASPRLDVNEGYEYINYTLKTIHHSAKATPKVRRNEVHNVEADKEYIAQYYKPFNETLYKAQFR